MGRRKLQIIPPSQQTAITNQRRENHCIVKRQASCLCDPRSPQRTHWTCTISGTCSGKAVHPSTSRQSYRGDVIELEVERRKSAGLTRGLTRRVPSRRGESVKTVRGHRRSSLLLKLQFVTTAAPYPPPTPLTAGRQMTHASVSRIDVKTIFYVFYTRHVFTLLTCFLFSTFFYFNKNVGKMAYTHYMHYKTTN